MLPTFELHSSQENSKTTQKNMARKTKSVSPPAFGISSVYTGPIEPFNSTYEPIREHRAKKKKGKKVIFDICECNDEVIGRKDEGRYMPKTWESITKLYGDTNTTEVWHEPRNQTDKAYKGQYKRNELKNPKIDDDTMNYKKVSKVQKKKPKIQKNRRRSQRNHKLKEEYQGKIVFEHPEAHDKTSVVSLFRKDHKLKATTVNDTVKLEKKAKYQKAYQEDFANKTLVEKKCPDGPCVVATMDKNKSFLCKCVNRKQVSEVLTKECTQATCRSSRNLSSINSVIKMKENFLCMCHKYSQKIISLKPNTNICNGGLCQEAVKLHKQDFHCKCDKNQKLQECSDNTCAKHRDVNGKNTGGNGENQQILKMKLSKQQNILAKLNRSQSPKQEKKIDRKIITKTHESDQTGEPFFEIQVNPRDMCVLNPVEIKENILKFGAPEKKEFKCICPSRGRLRPREVCKSGACKKAYKNKQTNFNCWCDKKVTECNDNTCGVNKIRKKTYGIRKHGKQNINIQKLNKPLIEVQLDIDKMCVVNPKEIEDKIISNLSVDEGCSSGLCRDASLKYKPFYCKCIRKKIDSGITECANDTCLDVNRQNKSKFCSFCARICSKSENWLPRYKGRNQRRVKRRSFYEIGSAKLCRGRVCTKSENLYGSDGLYSHKVNLTHLPSCNCLECKSPKVPAGSKPKEKYPTRQENHSKLKSLKKDFSKIIMSKAQMNSNNVIDAPLHPKKVKESEVPKPLKDTKIVTKKKEKLQRKKLAEQRRNKIINQYNIDKETRRRAKHDKKMEKRAAKARLKEIKLMQKKMTEEPLDTNFCTALVLGILKIGVRTVFFIVYIIFTVIRDPKGSFWYVRDRVKDPQGTCNKLRKWFRDAITIKKLEISETVRGSDTLTILADHFQDSAFYQSFANKGRTKQDQMAFEQRSKARKRRIRKREHQAIHSCRHMLLTTLRHTPCLWVYHICPNFYPQCLSLLAFMRNFCHIMMFLAAFACWTPCILSFELCRAFLCCFMCTH